VGTAKNVAFGLIITVVVIFVFILITDVNSAFVTKSEMSQYRSLSDAQLNALAVDWEYNDILRNISKYKGEIIRFQGNVLTVEQAGGDRYALSVNVAFGDTIIVDYTGSRILSGDNVIVYGKVTHVTELKSLIGDIPFPYPVVTAVRLTCLNC